MKTLVIAEKPSVARDIAQALGEFSRVDGWLENKDTIISWGIGHLVEIYSPEAESGGRDLTSLPVIPERFELRAIEKTKAQLKLLTKLMRRSDVDLLVNGCDAGREGELIFRLIYEHAGCHKVMKRMWLQSLTAESIRYAFRTIKPGSEFDSLSDAAKCRCEADWIIGINGSRGITRLRERQTQKYEMMTAGRVQTPTLAIIVYREQEIKNFIPKDYWEVHAMFGAKAGIYHGKWFKPSSVKDTTKEPDSADTRLWEKAQADAIVAKCWGVAPTSVKDESKTTTSLAPKLFDLTSLQRESNKKFKFSAKKTLDIVQSLYEKHKATTYPRTDATALPEDYVEKAKEILNSFEESTSYGGYAKRVLKNEWVNPDSKRVFDNSKISDHFAIIPTGTWPQNLDENEAKIYDLIVRRFIAVFYPAAEYRLTQRVTLVAEEFFRSSGRVLVSSGWLEVYGKQVEEGKAIATLCLVAPGESVRNEKMETKSLQTKPPARFTEDSLLGAMEGAGKLVDDDELREAMKERGLGTPTTRAVIIEGLLADRNGQGRPKEPYVVKEGKDHYLVPTSKGIGLIEFLDSNGVAALTSPKMTGEWEKKLRMIEKGHYRRGQFMAEIATMTREIIGVIRQKSDTIKVSEKILSVACPKCGGGLISRSRTFDCQSECGFKLWRNISGRDLSDSEAEQLCRDRKIEKLDGFISREKKTKFSAGLRIDDEFKTKFVFEESAACAALKAPCPKCGSIVRLRGNQAYACDKGDFRVWKVVSGRALSDVEAERLIREGFLPDMSGFFSSSKQKKFNAGLCLSKDKSKVDFVFTK